MLARLLIAMALVLGTLPATAGAACHDEPMATMTMDHGAPAPLDPGAQRNQGEALCVGCIAPTTLKPALLSPPHPIIAIHGVPPAMRRHRDAMLTPEPPPPRV